MSLAWALASAALLATGCNDCGAPKTEAPPPADSAAQAEQAASAPEAAPSVPAEAPAVLPPLPAVAPIDDPASVAIADALELKFSDKKATGDMIAGTLTNKSQEPVAATNFWVYVYDKDGALVDRMLGQVAPAAPLAPGKSMDVKVGPRKTPAAAGMTIEAAVIWFRLGDERMWQNTARAPENRPKGFKPN